MIFIRRRFLLTFAFALFLLLFHEFFTNDTLKKHNINFEKNHDYLEITMASSVNKSDFKSAVFVEERNIHTSKGLARILQASVDLNDPEVIFIIKLEEEINKAGSFTQYVNSDRAALVVNSTYKDPKNINWTKVSENKIIEGAGSINWSDGVVLGLTRDNKPEMLNRKANISWDKYWFALTSLPRLISQGKIVDLSASEVSKDLGGLKQRSAIGFSSQTNTLYHIITNEQDGAISIETLAEIMLSIGCDEAMNLEGGNGVLMAHHGKVYVDDAKDNKELVRAPVIVVYDSIYQGRNNYSLRKAWEQFQNNSIF